ncbi:MAG: response regulator [Methylovulum sp.]|nr:response regulator [Methylovulum sp.]
MCVDSTVFLVDDDAAVRDALSISLVMAGFKIEVYPSGEAFLEAYTEYRRGCLLINLRQPDMEGLRVHQELIKRNFVIPVIFMIHIGANEFLMSAIRREAFCLLEKPFSRALLLDSIRNAMG